MSQVPGLQPVGLPALAAVCAAMLLLSMVTTWVPARRAARVNPIDALRVE
jgi:ABC-type lipoprotein release transport system permease subunit